MFAVHWVRQPEGKGLEWLGLIYYDADTSYAQSLQGRITITRDTNKGEVYLKLTGAKPEESGTYYCARRTHGLHIFGPPCSFVPLTILCGYSFYRQQMRTV
ncbi:hypothetical protein GDO78_016781 [Eleutherodactylus coqui]|uniref:Immunoglobulin V-set domain-containing protein n=1 Tax=Eleutherodactylus coqui TaxID=57060 RepID=A0A8J6BFM1_ELECQ|nr:hypothetical protein GDO78_016781 [Eleutherodactylus coqui]